MMRWYGMGFGAWLGMGLFWLVLVGVIVWLVVQLSRPRHGEARYAAPGTVPPWQGPMVPGTPMPGASAAGMAGPVGPVGPPPFGPGYVESPFEILDRRLAAGEIDLQTYQQLRAALRESRGGQP
ncbi:MAG TPA: hypothetical protein VGC04_06890 [Cellulomonas sp.]